jgi:hypothetical protein
MLVTLLMGLLADIVFGSASTMRRSVDTEVDRYFKERGFRSDSVRLTPSR